MQTAFDVYALTKAFLEADEWIARLIKEELGMEPVGPVQWVPENDGQRQLVRYFEYTRDEVDKLPELNAWARTTAEELNQILAEHGFSIQLESWQPSPDRFGVVAIYDITINWLEEGSITDDDGNERRLPNGRPAFRLGDGAEVEFYRTRNGQVVVRIPGEDTNDAVYLTKADQPLEQFELLAEAEQLSRETARARYTNDFGGILMPNVLMDVKPEIAEWLVGFSGTDAAGSPWTVMQALMQVKFALGPKGARAKVAVAIEFSRSVAREPGPDYVVDHDILVWMERPDLSTPFFAAYVPMSEFADHQVGLDEI